MILPPTNIFRRQEDDGPDDGQAPSQADVPLWAFVVMTVFSVVLMAVIVLLLLRPDIFRGPTKLSYEEWKAAGAAWSPKPMTETEQHQHQQEQDKVMQGSRAGSLRRPWFRSGSFRSNIDRWRRGVDVEAQEGGEGGGGGDGLAAAYHYNNNYATPPPQPVARPVSGLQRIPECEQQQRRSETRPATVGQQR